ncbi:ArgE/DapE family deacylase [Candidatus Bathyarchaeota archaeon]|nr:ArgE/DapE family deacylase [Candidatus Bathyarchaeota archaeon]
MSLSKIFSESEKAQNEVSEIASGLVKLNSAHPDGKTVDCVEYIRKYFDEKGIEYYIHAKEDNKPNIVGVLKGQSKKKILWVGHLDVVPVGEIDTWTYHPFSGKIIDGKVWGRGSSDMKGSCAAAMVAARILSKQKSIPNTVEFWFTADEEIGGGAGARWLSETKKLNGDVCIIGDGNGGGYKNPSIDLGCKGGAGTKLIARGKTAHGSTPYLGDNAIMKLLKVIPYIYKIGDYKLKLPAELEKTFKVSTKFYMAEASTPLQKKAVKKLFFYPTVACNIINGGVKTNVVPDYAEADFDIRLSPGAKVSEVRAEIERLVKEAGIPGVEVDKTRIRTPTNSKMDSAGYYESPNSEFMEKLSLTIKKATKKKPKTKILTGGTDGVSTSKIAGIPSLGYGTSLTGKAHQPDEYITIENLVLGIKVYAGFPIIF